MRARTTISAGASSVDRNYHVFSHGRLERKDDTVRLVTEDDEKKYLPIERAEALFLHGQIDFNTRLMSFLDDHGVALHVFGWNDRFAGSIMPSRGQTSGRSLVKQVRAYDDRGHRLSIAEQFVDGSLHNMRANVKYYDNRDNDYEGVLEHLDDIQSQIPDAEAINELMSLEARARKAYYRLFRESTPAAFAFGGRSYNPPRNELNSLISYGNGLLYANAVSAIRKTALDPAVSFLHEPGERRYSLSLDLADVFKPVIVDRLILRLVNRGRIQTKHFEDEVGRCLLTREGRRRFTAAFEEVLERTIDHPRLNRKVSYQYLLRIEVYKLKKHLLTGEPYQAFRRWW